MLLSTNKMESLKKRRENALGIFRKSVSDLALVNSEIEKEKAKKQQEINDLMTEVKELSDIKQENDTFITKINDLLGVTNPSS